MSGWRQQLHRRGRASRARSNAVLILDIKGYYARDIVRCLTAAGRPNSHVLAPEDCLARYTRFSVFHPLQGKRGRDEDLLSTLRKLRRSIRARILLPVDEQALAFVARNQRELAQEWYFAPLANRDAYAIASDKARLSRHLAEHGLPQPETVLAANLCEALAAAENMGFPVLLKPLTSPGGGHGIRRCDDAGDLRTALINGVPAGGILVQSLLRGEDVDCSMLCLEGRVLAYTVQRPAARPARPYTPALALHFSEDREAFAVASKLIASLGFSGVAHVDMRRPRGERTPRILEINARFWQTLIASLAAGVNFPHLACQLACGDPFTAPDGRAITFVPLRTLVKSWCSGRFLGLARPWRLRTGASYVISDYPAMFRAGGAKIGTWIHPAPVKLH